MRSRTSFFNKTVFKKNLTRFAPVWGVYTLCLTLGILLTYSNGGSLKQWHFAYHMAEMPQYMALVNLFYAPVVAQLIFGDLYSSRMCNALHAMPIRRENWFFTNYLSGLSVSVLPGLVVTLLSALLCGGSLIRDAWQLPWLTLAASTLQFVCYFGIAIFAAMCSGNRLGMLLIYGLVNGGAFIAYWLVDTVYTPMLYGVVTPTVLVETLTPMANMLDNAFVKVQDALYQLKEQYGNELNGAFSTFQLVRETWGNLLVWTAAGAVFAVIGLVLYKKRDLECAGDAMAFRVLEPVFQVLGAVVCAAAAQFFLYMFLGSSGANYLFLAAGLVVGWFACCMLIERTTRVFRLKNWAGLAGLTAAVAISLFLTHIDILGVETWQPKAEDVASVKLSYGRYELTDREDIQKLIDIQSEALETRLDKGDAYAYVQDASGQWVPYFGETVAAEELEQLAERDGRYAFYTNITYRLKSGKEVARRYTLWSDGQAADHYRSIMSRWEYVNSDQIYTIGSKTEVKVLDLVLEDLEMFDIEGIGERKVPEWSQEELTELAKGFIAAVQADCAEGNMTPNTRLHRGHFRREEPESIGGYYYRQSVSVALRSEQNGWYIDVFPDSHHTVRWLQEHDLLNWEIRDNILIWY